MIIAKYVKIDKFIIQIENYTKEFQFFIFNNMLKNSHVHLSECQCDVYWFK